MIKMPKQYKVIQCPHCLEYSYIPDGVSSNSCPRCKVKIALHELQGTLVISAKEAKKQVQQKQFAFQGIIPQGTDLRPTKQILQLLRSHYFDTPKWLPIQEVFRRLIEAGLIPKEVQEAIKTLHAEGFLEKREDTIRIIPLT